MLGVGIDIVFAALCMVVSSPTARCSSVNCTIAVMLLIGTGVD